MQKKGKKIERLTIFFSPRQILDMLYEAKCNSGKVKTETMQASHLPLGMVASGGNQEVLRDLIIACPRLIALC